MAAMVWARVDGSGIPGSSHGDRYGEDGSEAVDDIEAKDERNVQTSVIDG